MNQIVSLQQLWETAPLSEENFRWENYTALPEIAQCYLKHAIAPEIPLASAVHLTMHGEIKLKNWLPFTAEQVIAFPLGFIWKATMKGIPIRGFDQLVQGEGKMQWKLLGLLPVMEASGEDIARSAIGRMLGECMWLPSVLCRSDVTWKSLNASQVIAHLKFQAETIPLTLSVNTEGQLETIQFPRWGNPDEQGYRNIPFGGMIEAEQTFAGYTIPTRIRGGWFFDGETFQQDGEFFRATIDQAIFR
ncbi:hypothetical protein PCC7418_3843 [Halothece sp. PCC 7418]|uniref:DUF6920 family protein n=1 Tax=Halothece sp. (strain PCC 7418) TaxID=65093 RepID=UPI0002A08DC7|nr:DUF6544 family protein [Halothece sp. PCC 7418]AFZ45947.1 hypothetical protein PCC7418_3843 [Halothece sp. PCC 7418]